MKKYEAYTEILNLPAVTITDVSVKNTRIDISCTLAGNSRKCPKCGLDCTLVNDRTTREIRDLNVADREVYLLVTVRQFSCTSCGHYHTECPDFADSNKCYTHRQSRYIFEICKKQSYQEVAAIVNMSSKTIERVVLSECTKREQLEKRYAQVTRLGIDEQSHRKGKKDYICMLTDLDRGIIIDILPSRKKAVLLAHFQSLGQDFCNQITDVSCDIWMPYISIAKECFPKANLVLDRFHVTKQLNERLDDYRKELRKELKDQEEYKKLKWILYKQYHRLTDTEIDNLQAAFEINPALKEYYFIREQFHHIMDNEENTESAVEALDIWVENIQKKEIVIFDTFIKTLQNHKVAIANYVKDKLSNAVTEGLNNLVRSIRRCAFGMPNFEHIRLRAMAISI